MGTHASQTDHPNGRPRASRRQCPAAARQTRGNAAAAPSGGGTAQTGSGSEHPVSATTEFFICIGAQPSLDDGGHRSRDHRGFAAFGRVTRGMDVVRAIHISQRAGQTLRPPIKGSLQCVCLRLAARILQYELGSQDGELGDSAQRELPGRRAGLPYSQGCAEINRRGRKPLVPSRRRHVFRKHNS